MYFKISHLIYINSKQPTYIYSLHIPLAIQTLHMSLCHVNLTIKILKRHFFKIFYRDFQLNKSTVVLKKRGKKKGREQKNGKLPSRTPNHEKL